MQAWALSGSIFHFLCDLLCSKASTLGHCLCTVLLQDDESRNDGAGAENDGKHEPRGQKLRMYLAILKFLWAASPTYIALLSADLTATLKSLVFREASL